MATTTLQPSSRVPLNFKSLLLLIFALFSFVNGLAGLVRGLETNMLFPAALIGLVLGWLLARTRIREWLGLAIGLGIGLTLIFVQIGGLDTYFIEAVDQLGLSWPRPELSLLFPIFRDVAILLALVAENFLEWLFQLIVTQKAFDPIMLTMLWGLGVWAASFWASWAMQRSNNVLSALTPTLLIYTSSLDFTGENANQILPIIAVGLALMIFVRHEKFTASWQENNIHFPNAITRNTNRMALGISFSLMVAAAIIPSISFEKIEEFFNRFEEEKAAQQTNTDFGESLGLEPENDPVSGDALRGKYSGGLPNRHLINAGPELSEEVVMQIEVTDPFAPEKFTGGAPTYYFRSLTYQTYTVRGWGTRTTSKNFYEPGQPAITQLPPNQRPLRVSVEMLDGSTGGLIYAPGTTVVADANYRIEFRSRENRDNSNDIFGALIGEAEYQVESYLPLFGAQDLRAAGQDYPGWVTSRYLDLPDTVTDRVIALANEITITAQTPYDRAVAIEAYLRTFPYTTDITAPSYAIDIADYFLFEVQEGYCDYYASSMVVMARAVGLPARLVIGYIGQTYDQDQGAYVVTADQAHSWVEIYFPNYGWVEFEPTAGRPTIERPEDSPEALPVNLVPPGEAFTRPGEALRILMQAIGSFFFTTIIILIPLSIYLIPRADIWNLQRKTPTQVATILFNRLRKFGSQIDLSLDPRDTPQEFSQRLTQQLNFLSNGSAEYRRGSVQEDIDWLTKQTIRTLFSPEQPQTFDKGKMIVIWKNLRWEFLRTRWQLWLTKLKAQFSFTS